MRNPTRPTVRPSLSLLSPLPFASALEVRHD